MGGERIARYSFLGRDPVATVEARGGGVVRATRTGDARAWRATSSPRCARALGRTRGRGARPAALHRRRRRLPHLRRGAALRADPRPPRRRPAAPLASFSFYRSLVAFDHVRQRLVLIADAEPGRRAAFERGAGGAGRAGGRPAPPAPAARRGARRPRPPRADAALSATARPSATRCARAKEYIAAGDIFQVVLSRQRTVRLRARPLHRLPRAAHGEPVALHVLPQGRRHARWPAPRRRCWCAWRTARGDAAHRRHAPARRHRGGGRAARPRAAGRREGARRAPDAGGPGPQRPRPRLPLPQRDRARVHERRALQPRHPHRQLGGGRAGAGQGRARRAGGHLPRGHAHRRAQDPGHGDHRRAGAAPGAASTAAPSATSTCAATSTSASPSAPWSCEDGRATVQAGAGIVADSDPEAEQRETEAKAGAMLRGAAPGGKL